MKYWCVVNTMNSVSDRHIGTILSRHKTEDAAQAQDASIQRRVKAINGQTSYIPTRILLVDFPLGFSSDVYERESGVYVAD